MKHLIKSLVQWGAISTLAVSNVASAQTAPPKEITLKMSPQEFGDVMAGMELRYQSLVGSAQRFNAQAQEQVKAAAPVKSDAPHE